MLLGCRTDRCVKEYYTCNSEQLKVKDMYLYEEDPGKKKAAAQAYYDAYMEERKTSTSSYIMMHIGRRERLPLVPIMMLTRSREKCLLGLIMMPTRRGDRHHFTVMHTRSIYQTEIFQEVPLLYPEGKCFIG